MNDHALKWTFAALLVLLAIDIAGAAGLLHPRKCPACEQPYHRGSLCDWSAHEPV